MTLALVLLCIAGLVLLISVGKVNAFAAFLLMAFAAGVLLGMPLTRILKSIEYFSLSIKDHARLLVCHRSPKWTCYG